MPNVQKMFLRVGLSPVEINGKPAVALGGFIITHYNYYFVVQGKIPLNVAEELYAIEPLGREDIRSGGDCGCREPKTWATYMNGDKVIISYEEYQRILKLASPSEGAQVSEMAKEVLKNEKYYFPSSEDERLSFPAHISTYHIDSELGLYVFLQVLRKHKLIP